jgi:putative ABC transport system permease protein
MSWADDFLVDLRFGGRLLRRNPGFAAAAIATLALGIGANTAMFSVADGLLLRPPPFDHPERVYWIYDVNPTLQLSPTDMTPPSPGNFVDWRQSRAFDHMIAWRNWFVSVGGRGAADEAAEQVRSVTVSPDFFEMLGVRAALGRTFRADEERPGAGRVAVLSNGFWRRHFGGNPAIVGATVTVDGQRFTVIGIMPPTFFFIWRDSAIFFPMTVDAEFRSQRGSHSIAVLARLSPGTTLRNAESDLERINGDLRRAYPATNDGWSTALVPAFPLNTNLRPALMLLLGAVGCVLLVACINVGNLLLVRSGARERELTVRTAVGASRGRLVRQMLAESALLAVCGAALAAPLAAVALRSLTPFLPESRVARAVPIGIDGRALAVMAGAALATAFVLGTLPAWHATRTERLRVSAESFRPSKIGGALLAVEVALSLMLLITATLLVRSFWNLQRVDPGFRADRVSTMQLWLPLTTYPDGGAISRFYDKVLWQLEQEPDVAAAAAVNVRPFLGWALGARLQIAGRASAGQEDPIVEFRVITPGYFATLGVPLIAGRTFTVNDAADAVPVAIVNSMMARRFWPGGDPIGKAVRLRTLGSTAAAPWWPERSTGTYTVVGTVGDMREGRLDGDVRPVVYVCFPQNPSRYAHLLVRTARPAVNALDIVRRRLQAVDPDMGLYDVQSMENVLGQAVASPRLSALVLWVFSVAALLLCTIGVYGVVSYAVARRTREFAIKLAIGATPGSIWRTVTRDGVMTTGCGVALGVSGALLLSRALAGLVFGVESTDGVAIAASSLVVFVVAMAACLRPARRATQVDPMSVLRAD